MFQDTVEAVAADAAVAVAAAAAAAAAQGKRPLDTNNPFFVDGTSYLVTEDLVLGYSCSGLAQSDGLGSDLNVKTEEEWNGKKDEKWRYLRLLSGHWSPWTVTALVLNNLRFPPEAWREFRCCTALTLLHLEDCGVKSTEFCCDIPSLRRLLLPHNQIRSLHGMKNLPRLKELCLKGNPICTFRDLAPLSGFPSLSRLDLQAIDGSEWAPVCKERGYQEAVLALLPRQALYEGWGKTQNGSPRGLAGCITRLHILDGRRLHLPPLAAAAAEASKAAAETTAATRLFRENVQRALDTAAWQVCPSSGGYLLAPGPKLDPASLHGEDCQSPKQRRLQQPASQLLVPEEVCQALRKHLYSEVQEALSNMQQLVQQVHRYSAEAKRMSFSLGGKLTAPVVL